MRNVLSLSSSSHTKDNVTAGVDDVNDVNINDENGKAVSNNNTGDDDDNDDVMPFFDSLLNDLSIFNQFYPPSIRLLRSVVRYSKNHKGALVISPSIYSSVFWWQIIDRAKFDESNMTLKTIDPLFNPGAIDKWIQE